MSASTPEMASEKQLMEAAAQRCNCLDNPLAYANHDILSESRRMLLELVSDHLDAEMAQATDELCRLISSPNAEHPTTVNDTAS